MKLRMITEKKEPWFTYVEVAKDLWRKKVLEAQEEYKIWFDLENDYDVVQREIIIPQTQWDHTKCKFKCELYSAGGDWQSPVLYFRYQLADGYAKGMSQYNGTTSYGVFIPGKDGGNQHLEKTKKGWSAPDGDEKSEGNERKAWAALKTHLTKLVEDEIKDVKSGNS